MNMLIVCLIAFSTAQGWDRPVIKEAELAAPEAPQQQTQSQATDTGASANELSWDMDTPSQEEAPRATAGQQLYWEYDEDGQPVARPAPDVQRTDTPKSLEAPPPQKQPQAQPQAQPEQARQETSGKHAGRIATFWMVLPPR